ncbi:hypothetical protein EDF73_10280 [Raoultella sp. BIGb0138]|uniref:hypothetical protein n=1 Tax=Raoultella sp. BIGb0138 TaxID=2485115 RepID=UPI00104C2342|nr:hypothetical protein [Raoultella sp. BIGb0138]TCW16279.1 hypothetical protein EDF73_10280 [Raoultella sp. BIGb0138]
MQGQLCITLRQRQSDSPQNIFFIKRCWRIVAVLVGLFILVISPYTRAEQSSAAVEQSTAEGNVGNKPLRKLSPKQFYVEVGIPGDYNISILFDTGLSANKSSKDYQPEIKKFMEREREVFTLFKKEVEGEINIYRIANDKFVREIKIPTENGRGGNETIYLIDRAGTGRYYVSFWLDKGRHIIIPDIYSHHPDFVEYTFKFGRVYGK